MLCYRGHDYPLCDRSGSIRHAWSPALPQFSLDGAAEGTAGGNREHQKGAVRYMLRAFGNTGRAQAAWRKRQCQ